MGDDLVGDGILPSGKVSDDDEFDPNAVESDDFLDDPAEVILPEDIADATAGGVIADSADDDDPLEEDE